MAWYNKTKTLTKQFLKKKEVWIGFVAGLALSVIFALVVGFWFGWPQLDIKNQWDFGLKILGGSGALVIFIWTVNQWFLTKNIEFVKSILTGINERHAGFVKEKSRLEEDNVDNKNDVQIETIELIIQSLLVDEGIVRKTNMGFKELRLLFKKYLGSPHPDMEELWSNDLLEDQRAKIEEALRKI